MSESIEKLFAKGTVPDIASLTGEHYVKAPWFPWLSIQLLGHRKSIAADLTGRNVLDNGFSFGYFILEKHDDHILINYDIEENPEVMRRVVDRLRVLPDGRLAGRLSYRFDGKNEQFIEYFIMERKV